MQSNLLLLSRAVLLIVLVIVGCGSPGGADRNSLPASDDVASSDPDQPVSNLDPTAPPPNMCQEELDAAKRVTVVLTMESYPPQYVVRDEAGTE